MVIDEVVGGCNDAALTATALTPVPASRRHTRMGAQLTAQSTMGRGRNLRESCAANSMAVQLNGLVSPTAPLRLLSYVQERETSYVYGR